MGSDSLGGLEAFSNTLHILPRPSTLVPSYSINIAVVSACCRMAGGIGNIQEPWLSDVAHDKTGMGEDRGAKKVYWVFEVTPKRERLPCKTHKEYVPTSASVSLG